ncbi:metal ABC transporter substrate-binding protein [Hydrogenothermus marinus]|uniref:Zinc transport system substrate-binding protein n=1 Tax=Hydrogenothermus marinus TaxID=133270 RepID=A0A3M0B7L4_9AQUI|nr:metal ABC transporter substrate-binding protein [Hydrogenothermus marinus]RMA93097.1 zinc transport system substrate-binding protein [Hydrogenothermus marinus]
MRKILILLLLSIYTSFAITITTTVKSVADIVKEITKEKAKVYYIIPPNASIHTYEYKASDLKKVYQSDIFLYIGSGEPNINNIIKLLPKGKQIKVSDIKGIKLIKEFEFKEHTEEQKHHHETFHPALWLDPENAKIIAKAVYKRLIKIDPRNKRIYEKNLKSFEKKVDEIIKYGKDKINKLKNKNFISYHYAWPYFTKRFGLKYLAVIELGHGREPTPKHIIKLINLIKTNHIKSIFAAKQFYNPKYADLVKNATKVNIIFLDPFGINKNYIQMIKFNIDKVYEGLK